jgi:hypothetical protein
LLAASLSSRLNVPDRNIARGERVNAAHRRMAPQGEAKLYGESPHRRSRPNVYVMYPAGAPPCTARCAAVRVAAFDLQRESADFAGKSASSRTPDAPRAGRAEALRKPAAMDM